MTDYTDAILHIADYPALAAAIAARSPGLVSEDGQIVGFATTPAVRSGVAALVYVRMTTEEAAQWRGTPGVTILGEAPYTGPETADLVYADAMSNPLYAAVYDPQSVVMEDGTVIQPPQRFGVLA